jgi:hypothetical protein
MLVQPQNAAVCPGKASQPHKVGPYHPALPPGLSKNQTEHLNLSREQLNFTQECDKCYVLLWFKYEISPTGTCL